MIRDQNRELKLWEQVIKFRQEKNLRESIATLYKISETYHDFHTYNEVIQYSTYNVAIFDIVNQKIPPDFCIFFSSSGVFV